jgi:hypothetical protein
MPSLILTLTNDRLQPALYPSDARKSNGKYAASTIFPKGCVIGRKTSDGLLYPTKTVNVVQNFTQTGTATAGTVTLTVPKAEGSFGTTTALAYNVSLAALQTALDVATGVVNGVVATSVGSAAPFSTPAVLTLTYSGTGYASLNQPLATADITNLTGTTALTAAAVQPNRTQVSIGGDVVGTTKITIDDTTFTEDGTERAIGFNEFGFQTDASSQCFMNTGTAVGDTVITPTMTMPYFIKGIFKKSDLVGWNDAMLAHLGARMHTTDLIIVP